MSPTQQRRRVKRRAQSLVFEAIAATDAGDLRLAEALIQRASTAAVHATRVESERAFVVTRVRDANALVERIGRRVRVLRTRSHRDMSQRSSNALRE